MPYMIHFRVNVWLKSRLSVISIKKSCLIEVMFSIIELLASSPNIRRETLLSEESFESI